MNKPTNNNTIPTMILFWLIAVLFCRVVSVVIIVSCLRSFTPTACQHGCLSTVDSNAINASDDGRRGYEDNDQTLDDGNDVDRDARQRLHTGRATAQHSEQ